MSTYLGLKDFVIVGLPNAHTAVCCSHRAQTPHGACSVIFNPYGLKDWRGLIWIGENFDLLRIETLSILLNPRPDHPGRLPSHQQQPRPALDNPCLPAVTTFGANSIA
jgi:hypothetical protein